LRKSDLNPYNKYNRIRHTQFRQLSDEHTTNLATGVSWQPVLDCGTIFHPDCGGRNVPSIPSDNLWKHISLATEAPSESFDL